MTATVDDAARQPETRRLAALLVGLVALVFVAPAVCTPHDGFWIIDNGAKFVQVQSILRSGYQRYDILWPGRVIDPALQWQPFPHPFGRVVDGRLYCQYPPFFALVSAPLYQAFGHAGLYVLPLLGGLAILAGVWRLAALLSAAPLASFAAVVVAGLATPLWFYSATFWEHTPAVALTTWAVAALLAGERREHGSRIRLSSGGRDARTPPRMRSCIRAGTLMGLAIWFRDELYLLAALLAVVLLLNAWRTGIRWRAVAAYCVACGAALTPLWIFQALVLGNPLGHHFNADDLAAGGLLRHLATRWHVLRNLLLMADESAAFSLVLIGPGLLLWAWYPRLSPRTFERAAGIVAGGTALAAAVIFWRFLTANSPMQHLFVTNSLFAVTPVLFLGALRVRSPRQSATDGSAPLVISPSRMLWLIGAGYALVYILVAPLENATGCHWGGRFLLPLYPLLAVLAAVAAAEAWRQQAHWRYVTRGLLLAGVCGSVLLQVYSLAMLHQRKSFIAALNAAAAERPEAMIIADETAMFMPLNLANVFYEKPSFLVTTPEEASALGQAFCERGIPVALWITRLPPPSGPIPPGAEAWHDGWLNFIAPRWQGVDPCLLSTER